MKKTDYITLRIEPKTKEILQEIAKEEDRSLSYVANKIIEKYLSIYITKREEETPV